MHEKTAKNGYTSATVTLKDVLCTPKSKFNLLSVSKMIKDGWNVKGSKGCLAIEKDNVTLAFDIIKKTQRVQLFCANMQ